MAGIYGSLAQVARLAFPYFRSEEWWVGRGLLGAILAIELGQVGIAVLLNSWNARFHDALRGIAILTAVSGENRFRDVV